MANAYVRDDGVCFFSHVLFLKVVVGRFGILDLVVPTLILNMMLQCVDGTVQYTYSTVWYFSSYVHLLHQLSTKSHSTPPTKVKWPVVPIRRMREMIVTSNRQDKTIVHQEKMGFRFCLYVLDSQDPQYSTYIRLHWKQLLPLWTTQHHGSRGIMMVIDNHNMKQRTRRQETMTAIYLIQDPHSKYRSEAKRKGMKDLSNHTISHSVQIQAYLYLEWVDIPHNSKLKINGKSYEHDSFCNF